MSKPVLGLTVGAILGLLDGASAWFSPEARPLMLAIVVGSTLKGLATGLIAGLVARWRRSTWFGIGTGVVVGFVLSSLAAIGQTGHYFEIVLPGMLVGGLTGFVTQRYPQFPTPNRAASVWLFALLVATVSSAVVRTHAQSAPPADTLAPLALHSGLEYGLGDRGPEQVVLAWLEVAEALGEGLERFADRSVHQDLTSNGRRRCGLGHFLPLLDLSTTLRKPARARSQKSSSCSRSAATPAGSSR